MRRLSQGLEGRQRSVGLERPRPAGVEQFTGGIAAWMRMEGKNKHSTNAKSTKRKNIVFVICNHRI